MPESPAATPPAGDPITLSGGILQVPDRPIVPFVEGDGTGRDIWRASRRVFEAAVEKCYGAQRRVAWFEVLAGEKAFKPPANGCRRRRWRPSASTWSASRVPSPRRWEEASAP